MLLAEVSSVFVYIFLSVTRGIGDSIPRTKKYPTATYPSNPNQSQLLDIILLRAQSGSSCVTRSLNNMVLEKLDKFSLLTECFAAESIPVRKYRSARSGLTVIHAAVPGPLVNGYFFVATEAHDDDGLPHTLEHLIFLGSRNYPYKGTLDINANRCLAGGTNAWTESDHTAYTVSTAGSEGFLNLLPIYLDHLFFPTLTDAGFVTEVYHITGEATESGVVFCEMQGAESQDSCVMLSELQRTLFKENCGYRYETGGSLCNLRYSTSNEKVRKFHKQLYCPLNTTIFVAGTIDVDKLLDVCHKFEEKLMSEADSSYEKAWQTPIEPIKKSITRACTYQSEVEDNGCVTISWYGPSMVNEYYLFVASDILFTYLTDTSASPLMKYFVEISDPYCSDVSIAKMELTLPAFSIEFQNVVITQMASIHEKLMEVLQLIVNDNDNSYKITRDRMVSVIEKYTLEQLLRFEENPHIELAVILIRDTLFGQSPKDLDDKLNIQRITSRLLNEPTTFWITLLNDYFLKKPSATILGYPWKCQEILQTQLEDERLAERRAILGEKGLEEKTAILKTAIEQNGVMPPDELINLPLPSVDDLKYHPIRRYTTSSKEQHEHFNISSSPVFTHLDDLNSKFVYAHIVMDSRKLPKRLRVYLSLFLEYVTSCPIRRDGEIVSHEQVAQELEKDLISLKSSIGLFGDEQFSSSSYSYSVFLSMVMTEKNFEKGMTWIRSLLYDSVFTYERLVVTVKKLTNSISQARRQGRAMVQCLMKLITLDEDNHRTNTVLSQQNFLSSLITKLEDEKERELIINDLEEIRSILASPENMILHLSINVEQLAKTFTNPAKSLSRILPENAISNQKRFEILQDSRFLSTAVLSRDDKMKSCVVGMPSEDASFMLHTTKSICDFNDPDLPALLVCVQYLTQLEGPLWRNIRGFGLAYGTNIYVRPSEGTLTLMFYRSVDIVQAFNRTKEIVLEIINSNAWSPSLLESGIGASIFDAINKEKNIVSISQHSLLAYFHGTEEDYRRKLIRKIREVKISEMKMVANKYLVPLFDPKTSLSTIVCHTSKCENVSKGFAELGHDLVVFPSLEDSYLASSFIASLL